MQLNNRKLFVFLGAKLISAVIALLSLAQIAQAQEQKILFCAESISFRIGRFKLMDADTCKRMCEPYSGSNCLSNETMNGWKVSSITSKEATAYGGQDGGSCSCVGTQYALRKEPQKEQLIPPASDNSSKRAEQSLWQDLEKEIDIFKQISPIQSKKGTGLSAKTSKVAVEIFRGQVFVVKKDLTNTRLALVGVAAFNERDFSLSSQWQLLLINKLRDKFMSELGAMDTTKDINMLAETENEFSEMIKAGFAEARGTMDAVAYNGLLSKRNAAWAAISGNPEKIVRIKAKLQHLDMPEFAVRSLPDPVTTVKTDSDGNFEMSLPVGSYVLRAKTSSSVSTTDEEFLWFVKVSASKTSPKLVLSNDNLFGSNCNECAAAPKL